MRLLLRLLWFARQSSARWHALTAPQQAHSAHGRKRRQRQHVSVLVAHAAVEGHGSPKYIQSCRRPACPFRLSYHRAGVRYSSRVSLSASEAASARIQTP